MLCGSLAIVGPLDLIEWLCRNQKHWRLCLNSQGIDGEVVVRDGQIVDARWGNERGMQALSEIVGCQWGVFDILPVSGPPERTVHGNWRSLLLSAVQILDERRELQRLEQVPRLSNGQPNRSGKYTLVELSSDGEPRVETGIEADHLATVNRPIAHPGKDKRTVELQAVELQAVDLIDDGFAAFRAGNIALARQRWTEALALEPDNRSIQFNLRRLDLYT